MAGGTFTISNVSTVHAILIINNEIRAASLAHLWEHPSSISLKPVNTQNCPVTSKLIRKSAVLGLHAIKEKPVAINGKVEIRPVSGPHERMAVMLTDVPDDVPRSHI